MINREIILNKDTRKAVNGNLFELGIDGENLQENIIFKFEDEFVDGQARVEIELQNGDKSYITIEKQEESYVFPIKSVLTKKGLHQLELVITQGTDDEEIPIFKSEKISFLIKNAINAVEEAPEGYEQWLDVANTKLNQMDNLDIEAEQTISGATITITKKDGTEESVVLTNGINGVDGTDGIDGFSPIASVTQISGGASISITDSIGTTTATISNGEDGQAGQNGITPMIGDNGNWYLGETDTGKPSRGIQGETGQTGSPGEDGVSPTVTTSKSGNTTTITITDRTGEHTATIIDGVDGTDGSNGRDGYVQYTAGDNITIENNVISAVTSGFDDKNLIFAEWDNEFVINDQTGIFLFKDPLYGNKVYYKINSSDTRKSIPTFNILPLAFVILKKLSEVTSSNEIIGYLYGVKEETGQYSVFGIRYDIVSHYLDITNTLSSNYLAITNISQVINGIKTFNSIPQVSSYTIPSNDTQLVSKKDVDDNLSIKQNIIQYNTIPVATANDVGKIVQYTGTTDSTYTNGYFYLGVENNGVYSWENINVQAGSSGSDVAGVYSITSNSSNDPFVFDGKKQGVYFFTTDYNTNKFYYKTKDSGSVTTKNSTQMLYIELFKDVNYDNLESNETFGRAFYVSGSNAMKTYIKKAAIPVGGGASVFDLLTGGTQTIVGTKKFSSIPEVSLYTTPSSDTQLVAKKYVDDTIGNINTILATLTTPNS